MLVYRKREPNGSLLLCRPRLPIPITIATKTASQRWGRSPSPISAVGWLAIVGVREQILGVLEEVVVHVGRRLLEHLVLPDDHWEVEPSDIFHSRRERHHRPEVADHRQPTPIRSKVRLHDVRVPIEGTDDLSLTSRNGHHERPHAVAHGLDVLVANHLPERPHPLKNLDVHVCWLTGHLSISLLSVFQMRPTFTLYLRENARL